MYLTGSHTWSDLQDYGFTDPPPRFDYNALIDSLVAWNHNFLRLWRWEQADWQTEVAENYWFSPQPYARTGPGTALDGKPRFDLTRFDQSYFDRLRERVVRARAAGIYVSVMLFNGWSVEGKKTNRGNPWRGHPYHRENNVNAVDGDTDHDGFGLEVHTLANRRIVDLEERFVAKVVETVADLDNVLFEISNESRGASIPWQYHMVGYVQRLESQRSMQHPVGMTSTYPDTSNQALARGPAAWISPAGPLQTPPLVSGEKVVLWDTDHVCGLCGDRRAAWKAFTRGHNVLFMDPFDSTARAMDVVLGPDYDPQAWYWRQLRAAMGSILDLSRRLPLRTMLPRPELSSTGYCLADSALRTVLAYAPDGGRFEVDLSAATGPYQVEWYAPRSNRITRAGSVMGGRGVKVRPPFWRDFWLSRDAVLVLRRL